eukprot:5187486-Amphidinium_carterae.1
MAMADFADFVDLIDYVTPFMEIVSSAYSSTSSSPSPNTVHMRDHASGSSSTLAGQNFECDYYYYYYYDLWSGGCSDCHPHCPRYVAHYMSYYYGYQYTCGVLGNFEGEQEQKQVSNSNLGGLWSALTRTWHKAAEALLSVTSSVSTAFWSTIAMLIVGKYRRVIRQVCGHLWNRPAPISNELRQDVGRVLTAVFMLVSEIFLISAKRSCCLRRKLRQMGLRSRPIPRDDGIEDEDDGFVMGTPRRSLAEIQRHNGIVFGGRRIGFPRYMGRVRLMAVRTRRWRVVYNPRQPGHCLFSCVQRILDEIGHHHSSIAALRQLAQHLLATRQGRRIDGRSLEEWTASTSYSVNSFVKATTAGRWGTQLDLVVLA